jgi:hypothetical protein
MARNSTRALVACRDALVNEPSEGTLHMFRVGLHHFLDGGWCGVALLAAFAPQVLNHVVTLLADGVVERRAKPSVFRVDDARACCRVLAWLPLQSVLHKELDSG